MHFQARVAEMCYKNKSLSTLEEDCVIYQIEHNVLNHEKICSQCDDANRAKVMQFNMTLMSLTLRECTKILLSCNKNEYTLLSSKGHSRRFNRIKVHAIIHTQTLH
jgi:hypothetical protein